MPIEFAAQWLHILLGIFWFGSVMFADFVLGPGLVRMTAASQREFGINVGLRTTRIMTIVAIGVVAVGFVRGTYLGDVKSVDDLGTTYGLAWLVSLVAGVFLILWGTFVSAKALESIGSVAEADAPAMMRRALQRASIELVGFLVVFTAMIVMHYA